MSYIIHGRHHVLSALRNPQRIVDKVWLDAKEPDHDRLLHVISGRRQKPDVVARPLTVAGGDGKRRKRLAAEVWPLQGAELEPLLPVDKALLIIVAHLTDTGNVGAIIRSAYLLGASAVVMPKKRIARETDALAKAASGALDHLPIVRVTNLVRTLALLRSHRYWIIGLDQNGSALKGGFADKVALVIGREDQGIPPLLRKSCDRLWRLPVYANAPGAPDCFNASTAAAIAMTLLRTPQCL